MTLSELLLRSGAPLLVISDVRPLRTAAGLIVPAIPAAAVMRCRTHQHVFVLRPDQTIELRSVHSGPARGTLASVDGVRLGETIVYNARRSNPGAGGVASPQAVEPHLLSLGLDFWPID
jgi:hypothetical protein